jgi:hypothetical protein
VAKETEVRAYTLCITLITDPYRPSVGKTTPNDTPFIVKRRDELPASKQKGLNRVMHEKMG